MKITLTEFYDNAKLTVEADHTNLEVVEACKMITDFWSGAEDARFKAEEWTDLDLDDDLTDAEKGKVEVAAAAHTILSFAIGLAMTDHVRSGAQLEAALGKQEGFPEVLRNYGIHIKQWEFTAMRADDFDASLED